jgi:hypothetical protein
VGVVVKTVEKFLDALVDESVMLDLIGPVGKLRFRRKVAVKQQIGGFGIRAFLREFLDRITAVLKNALVAVNERDPAGAGGRVRKAGS